MTLTFNIIYTPGTVKYLSFLVWSLLRWSDYEFRLVSNGCFPPEQRYLAQLCRRHPRLTHFNLPGEASVSHGQALNHLQQTFPADYFAFIDSDILATGPFAAAVASDLAGHTACFAAPPLWATAADQVLPHGFRIMSGHHTTADNGLCLGSSPFSIYQAEALEMAMAHLDAGFEERRWVQLSPEIRSQLGRLGLEKDSYDTGKVLNLLLQAQGEKLCCRHIPALIHLGAVSFVAFSQPPPKNFIEAALRRVIKPRLPAAVRQAVSSYRTYRIYKRYSTAEYKAIVRQRQHQRNPTRQYFFKLLVALAEDQPRPPLPVIGVPEIDQRLRQAGQALIDLHKAVKTGRIQDHVPA